MKCMYNIINIHHIKSIQKTSIFSCYTSLRRTIIFKLKQNINFEFCRIFYRTTSIFDIGALIYRIVLLLPPSDHSVLD